jgi:23S rRNA (uracil1939-C5)-methyltransferase
MKPRHARARPPRESTFELRIDKLVYGGMGLGRHDGKVVFVPFTAPGDRVRVRAVERKKNFIRASLVELLEAGPGRQQPSCPHFGRCGGCQWQHLDYERQIEVKRGILQELFHHHLPESRELEIRMRGCGNPFGYRSRARVQLRGVGDDVQVGFFRYQSHRVEDVEECPLLVPLLNEALRSVRTARRSGSSDPGLHAVELACSVEEGSWQAAAIEDSGEEDFSEMRAASSDGEETLLRRTVGGFRYWFAPGVFFQANDALIADLAALVSDLARDAGTSAAADLFAGVGLFTLPLARRFERVVAVERSAAAADLCARNTAEAGLVNVEVVTADALRWMEAMSSMAPPAFDLVVLDPPRSGAGAGVMEQLCAWAPERIVYVSCDPNTLVRDVGAAIRHYRLDHIEGIDLFPQSYHFETVVRLRHR